jgi:hypothetical protein
LVVGTLVAQTVGVADDGVVLGGPGEDALPEEVRVVTDRDRGPEEAIGLSVGGADGAADGLSLDRGAGALCHLGDHRIQLLLTGRSFEGAVLLITDGIHDAASCDGVVDLRR